MAFDRDTPAAGARHERTVHPHRHAHGPGLPHSHGAPPGVDLGRTPAISLLRLSIFARLVTAFGGTAIIWLAVRWAMA
jgi:hypothetical protein